jgi:hypothetical protein
MKVRNLLFLTFAAVTSMLVSTAWPLDTVKAYLGAFSNVTISSESGDCDGISFQLWRQKDASGNLKISGIFYDASGGCPGASSLIAEAVVDVPTGRVELHAIEATTGLVVAVFKGTIESERMRGQFAFGNRETGETDAWSPVELKHLSTKDWKRVGGA